MLDRLYRHEYNMIKSLPERRASSKFISTKPWKENIESNPVASISRKSTMRSCAMKTKEQRSLKEKSLVIRDERSNTCQKVKVVNKTFSSVSSYSYLPPTNPHKQEEKERHGLLLFDSALQYLPPTQESLDWLSWTITRNYKIPTQHKEKSKDDVAPATYAPVVQNYIFSSQVVGLKRRCCS